MFRPKTVRPCLHTISRRYAAVLRRALSAFACAGRWSYLNVIPMRKATIRPRLSSNESPEFS